jgi:hypothetical protein
MSGSKDRGFRMGAALMLAVGILCASAGTSAAAPFTWSVSDNVAANQNPSGYSSPNPDENAAVFYDDGYYWSVYPSGGEADEWYTRRATTVTGLDTASVLYIFDAKTLPDRIGNEAYWVSGVWPDPDTGTWYAIVHTEFRYEASDASGAGPGFSHFRRIMLATSTDHGQTWTLGGDIVTDDHPTVFADTHAYPTGYFNYGPGDPRLFVDADGGYFYLVYQVGWNPAVLHTSTRYLTQRVARSPISAKMAPGSWVKWYRNGVCTTICWTQPGIGGHDSDILNGVDSATSIFKSNYLGKYVIAGVRQNTEYVSSIATATDLESQNWTAQEKFLEAPSTDPHWSYLGWYNWPLDISTGDEYVMTGSSFRLYSSNNDNTTSVRSKWMTITFDSSCASSNTCPTNAGFSFEHPPVDVPDHNPGWDSACTTDGCGEPQSRGTTVDDATTGSGSNQFNFSGTWSHCSGPCSPNYGYNAGTASWSNSTGASVSVAFTGTGIDLYGARGSNVGIASVAIDGGTAVKIDGYASAAIGNQVLFSRRDLSRGSHTLTVTVTGTKRSASSGTYVTVDRADVIDEPSATVDDSTLGTDHDEMSYTGSGWAHCAKPCSPAYGYYNATASYSNVTNDQAAVTFHGTGVKVYLAKGTNTGKATITVNGSSTQVDTYAATPVGDQLVYTNLSLPLGTYTVSVNVDGAKNTSSSGYYVSVDRIDVYP